MASTSKELKDPLVSRGIVVAEGMEMERGIAPRRRPLDEVKEVEIRDTPTLSYIGTILCAPISLAFCCAPNFYSVSPNEEAAITHLGKLTKVTKTEGLYWNWGFGSVIKKVSVKQLTMNIPESKVADLTGSPVQVSAILNYRIIDSKKALFSVQNYKEYVKVNATATLKQVVAHHTYYELKRDTDRVNSEMEEHLARTVEVAGIQVINMALNELNYAPEIAAAMLKKQQASALIEARKLIVDGAVLIAQDAITQLEADKRIVMDPHEKVKIVTNLLTITCGDKDATPTISL